MSRNINNFVLSPGQRRTGVRAYVYHTPNNSDSYEVPVFYRSRSSHATPYYQDERTSSALNSRWFLEDRTHAGLYSLPDLQAQPRRIFVLNGDTGRRSNPGFRETQQRLSVPTPRSTHQTNPQAPRVLENSRSRALSKLKKEVYDPNPSSTPKLLAKRLSMYYRDPNDANALREIKSNKEKDEDGKRCAVCLEDFEAKQEVMVTPCKHMFHEDCIVPWLGRQGQCPICRSVICKKETENPSLSSSSFNNDDIVNMAHSDVIAQELLSILRSMGEAFQLDSETY